MKKPVLFLIFNRPDTTKRVFEAIRQYGPKELYIAADGPRNKEESAVCLETRKIVEDIDWDCEVKTLFHEDNQGCRYAPPKAITWFFENVEMGIILEDDCVPNQYFFSFCDTLLNTFKDNERIMHINGSNFQNKKIGTFDYYFSHCAHVWGWATWKRAWIKYDFEMKGLDTFINKNKAYKLFNNKFMSNHFNKFFKYMRDTKNNSWGAQWIFSILDNNGVVITPNKNLVDNIGFGPDATHTLVNLNNTPAESSELFLNNVTEEILIQKDADYIFFKKIYSTSFIRKFLYRVNSNIKEIYSIVKK